MLGEWKIRITLTSHERNATFLFEKNAAKRFILHYYYNL